MIQVLLLDIGGVVLRIDPSICPIRNLHDCRIYDRFERGHIEGTEFFAHYSRELGVPEPDLLKRFNSIVIEELEGIQELMEEARSRVRLCALSNTNRTHMEHALPKFPSLRTFEKIYTSWELGVRKPEEAIYRRAVAELAVPAENILFIDDNALNVEGARKSGMKAEQSVNSTETLRAILKAHAVL